MSRVAILALIAIGACGDATSAEFARTGVWSSSEARAIVTPTDVTIQFRDGNCYGSFGTIPSLFRADEFLLPGTFTQLAGVEPGRFDYPATFAGEVVGNRLTVTMTVPALSRTVGPVTMNYGTGSALSACLYP